MDLRIVGCYGGETPRHRTSAFVLDDRLSIDAGSLTRGLELEAQYRLEACVISHAHLDHIRDLATIADNRCQQGCEPLIVAATKGTIEILRRHFFNGLLWPDFSVIPSAERPTIRFLELPAEQVVHVAGYEIRAIHVSHTIESAGFIIEAPCGGAIAYSGDTGPTTRLWDFVNEQPNLRALMMEVSFPNREQRVATLSGHHTPESLGAELRKFRRAAELPSLLYHLKPTYQDEIERECERLEGLNLTILRDDDRFTF